MNWKTEKNGKNIEYSLAGVPTLYIYNDIDFNTFLVAYSCDGAAVDHNSLFETLEEAKMKLIDCANIGKS